MRGTLFISLLVAFLVPFVSSYVTEDKLKSKYIFSKSTAFSFEPPYGAEHAFWKFGDDAMEKGDAIVLTNEAPHKLGWIQNNRPNLASSWRVDAEILIVDRSNGKGEGLAFWYIQDNDSPRTIEALGGANIWKGLAILFDTNDHDRKRNNPYVYVMVNDGTWAYEQQRDGGGREIGGCKYNFLSKSLLVRITYIESTLTIAFSEKNSDKWETCVEIPSLNLPTGYRFGVSASTGKAGDYQHIVSFIMQPFVMKTDLAQNTQKNAGSVQQTKEEPPASNTPKEVEPKGSQEMPTPPKDVLDPLVLSVDAIRKQHISIQDTVSSLRDVVIEYGKQVKGSEDELDNVLQVQPMLQDTLDRLMNTLPNKQDLQRIRSAALPVDQINKLQEEMKELKDMSHEKLKKGSESILKDVKVLARQMLELTYEFELTKIQQSTVENLLLNHTKMLTEGAQASLSIPFWIFFGLFQSLFITSCVWWYKHKKNALKYD